MELEVNRTIAEYAKQHAVVSFACLSAYDQTQADTV